MYEDRVREFGDSKLAARRHVGWVARHQTRRRCGTWVEQVEVDTGRRPGVSSDASAELKVLRRENAELRRANDILKTASAFFAAAELDRHIKSS